MVKAQSDHHHASHDYDKGSPHLRHPQLRGMIERRLSTLVADSIRRAIDFVRTSVSQQK